jgi:hypothetical protein
MLLIALIFILNSSALLFPNSGVRASVQYSKGAEEGLCYVLFKRSEV